MKIGSDEIKQRVIGFYKYSIFIRILKLPKTAKLRLRK